jgi:hypothetical protein
MILGEAVLIGVAGAVTGSLLGAVAAPELGAFMLKIGVSDPGFTVHIGLWPLVVAALAGTPSWPPLAWCSLSGRVC